MIFVERKGTLMKGGRANSLRVFDETVVPAAAATRHPNPEHMRQVGRCGRFNGAVWPRQ